MPNQTFITNTTSCKKDKERKKWICHIIDKDENNKLRMGGIEIHADDIKSDVGFEKASDNSLNIYSTVDVVVSEKYIKINKQEGRFSRTIHFKKHNKKKKGM